MVFAVKLCARLTLRTKHVKVSDVFMNITQADSPSEPSQCEFLEFPHLQFVESHSAALSVQPNSGSSAQMLEGCVPFFLELVIKG